jgi:hypothetical protein
MMYKTCRWLPAAIGSAVLFSLPQAHASQGELLFAESFHNNTSSNWTVAFSRHEDDVAWDYELVFGWDYSTMGIPAAPNSGGVTRGVKMAVNQYPKFGAGLAYAMSLTPNGQVFSGDYEVKFDLWMNFNGPVGNNYPAGGAGSTEFVTFGIGKQTNAPQYWGASSGTFDPVPAEGAWFAVDGDGGSGTDFRAIKTRFQQVPESGIYHAGDWVDLPSTNPEFVNNVRRWSNPYYHDAIPGNLQPPQYQLNTYPQQLASNVAGDPEPGRTAKGVLGFGWHEVTLTVRGQAVTWSINGLPIATITPEKGSTSEAAQYSTEGNIFIGYWDPFASLSDNRELSFGVIANLTVHELLPVVEGGYAAWAAERLPESLRAPDLDADGDGIPNIIEYALGLDPMVADVGGLPQGVIENTGGQDYLTLTINKDAAATGISLVVEVSSDLINWESGAAATTEVVNTDELLKVRDNVAMSGANRRFIRLKVDEVE